jgi:hypothetical protein
MPAGDDAWHRFAAHWDDLAPDRYAAELGIHRQRRYGHYSFANGMATPVPIGAFVQPEQSNPLFIGVDRDFEPLAETFARDPLLAAYHRSAASIARRLRCATSW